MNRDELTSKLRAFLSQELKHGAALADDEPLLELGLDSRGITELMSFVEKSFGVTLDEEEQEDPDHFENVNAIVALIARKLGQS